MYHCLAFKWCVNRLNDRLGEQCFGDQLLKETMDPQVKCQTNSELNRNNEGITVLALPSSSLLQQLMQCNAINSQVSLIVREPCY